jgi:hypothetical protein
MEPYGAPWLQPVATGRKSDCLKNRQNEPNRCRRLRPVAEGNGKEGVIGSSPIEGFAKSLLIKSFC